MTSRGNAGRPRRRDLVGDDDGVGDGLARRHREHGGRDGEGPVQLGEDVDRVDHDRSEELPGRTALDEQAVGAVDRRGEACRGEAVEVELIDPAVAPDLLLRRRPRGIGEALGGRQALFDQPGRPAELSCGVGGEGGHGGEFYHRDRGNSEAPAAAGRPRALRRISRGGSASQPRFLRCLACTSATTSGPTALMMSSASSSTAAADPSSRPGGSSGLAGVTSDAVSPVHVGQAALVRRSRDRGSARVRRARDRGCTSGPSRRSRRSGSRSSCTPRASAWPSFCRAAGAGSSSPGPAALPARARGRRRGAEGKESHRGQHRPSTSTWAPRSIDSRGHPVGKVENVFYDDRTLEPQWIAGQSRSAAPAQPARPARPGVLLRERRSRGRVHRGHHQATLPAAHESAPTSREAERHRRRRLTRVRAAAPQLIPGCYDPIAAVGLAAAAAVARVSRPSLPSAARSGGSTRRRTPSAACG